MPSFNVSHFEKLSDLSAVPKNFMYILS